MSEATRPVIPRAAPIPHAVNVERHASRLQATIGNQAMLRRQQSSIAPPIVDEVLRSADARPLDRATRDWFEPRLARDLGDVRVHTGPRAAASARAVGALAYTVGSHVVFGDGAYQPESTSGRRTLAHELTHVAQQVSTGGTRGDLPIGAAGDVSEREADSVADTIMFVGHAPSPTRHSNGPVLRRIIPSPHQRDVAQYQHEIEEARRHINAIRLRVSQPRYDSVRARLDHVLDVAVATIDAYERGAPAPPIGAPLFLLFARGGPPVLPVTPVASPATPIGVPATSAAAQPNLLGAVVVVGITVGTIIYSITTASTATAATWADAYQAIANLDAALDAAVATLPVPGAATGAPATGGQPAAAPTTGTVGSTTDIEDPPDQERCPPGQVGYSQEVAVARVLQLKLEAPFRIGMAGRASSMSQAEFLATILTVTAVVSVVGPNECMLASAEGIHDPGDAPHAEEAALRRLEPWRVATRAVPRGTRLAVVVSSEPCGTGRHDCDGQLRRFAARAPRLAYVASDSRYLTYFFGASRR